MAGFLMCGKFYLLFGVCGDTVGSGDNLYNVRLKMAELTVKRAGKDDLQELLELYTHLHNNPFPIIDSRIEDMWSRIINDINHHILLGYIDRKLVTSCVIVIIENLTQSQRPYSLIENVITHPDNRNKGYATLILSAAKDVAVKNNCYKIMLLTGSKQENTLNFYRRAGYNSNDKTAFIQWL
jgi:GNAT superfamily N-acetyltransferase